MLLVACPVSLLADTITLRNGKRIEGTILGQTRTSVRIRTQGRVRVISKKSIRRILYGTSQAKERERRQAAAERRRKAAEARKAEERRKAEEARKAEERRKAEEARKAEERRKAEEARKAEEQRKTQAARRAEERRRGTGPGGGLDRRDALVRSAIAPGLGLALRGRTLEGYGGGLLFAAAVGAAVAANQRVAAVEERYERESFLSLAFTSSALSNSQPALLAAGVALNAGGRTAYENSLRRLDNAGRLVAGLYLGQLGLTFLAEPGASPSPPRSRWSRVASSAMLPGWGLAESGRPQWGFAWLLVNGAALANVAVSDARADSAEATYRSRTGPALLLASQYPDTLGWPAFMYSNEGRGSYESALARYRSSLGILAAAYLGQLLHTWFAGSEPQSPAGSVRAPAAPFDIFLLPVPGPKGDTTLQFQLTFRLGGTL